MYIVGLDKVAPFGVAVAKKYAWEPTGLYEAVAAVQKGYAQHLPTLDPVHMLADLQQFPRR